MNQKNEIKFTNKKTNCHVKTGKNMTAFHDFHVFSFDCGFNMICIFKESMLYYFFRFFCQNAKKIICCFG